MEEAVGKKKRTRENNTGNIYARGETKRYSDGSPVSLKKTYRQRELTNGKNWIQDNGKGRRIDEGRQPEHRNGHVECRRAQFLGLHGMGRVQEITQLAARRGRRGVGRQKGKKKYPSRLEIQETRSLSRAFVGRVVRAI